MPRVSRSGKGGNITANFFSSVSTFSQPVGNGNFEPDSGLFAESTWQARLGSWHVDTNPTGKIGSMGRTMMKLLRRRFLAARRSFLKYF